MITGYKYSDLREILSMEKWLVNELSLVSDKLRTIYTTLGWTHMTNDFFRTDETVERLTMGSFIELAKGAKDIQQSSGGLTVSMWYDEDGIINVDYYFNLI